VGKLQDAFGMMRCGEIWTECDDAGGCVGGGLGVALYGYELIARREIAISQHPSAAATLVRPFPSIWNILFRLLWFWGIKGSLRAWTRPQSPVSDPPE